MKKIKYILLFISIFLIGFPNFSTATVSQNSLKSVVRIICVTEEGTWSGSGMIITNDGYILTNKHVVSGDAGNLYSGCSIGITNDEFSEPVFAYTAKTIIAANGADLALLKINSTKTDFNYSSVFLYYLPSQGTEIEALGYPLMGGDKITYTNGYVSGVIGSQEDLGNFFIKADLKVDAGNSGGPSFTNQGEFVGINSAVLAGKYNSLGLIIPSTTIFEFLRVNSYDYLITKIQKKDSNQSIQFNNYSESKSSSSQIPPDGSLVRADRNLRTDCPTCPPTVYLIDDGYKRGIGAFSEMTFANCGWKWEDVKVIDASIIESIPTGTNFDNFSLYEEDFPHPYKVGECWVPKDQRVIRKFPNGTLLQVTFKYWPNFSTHTIYLLENGKKRAFVSREVFEALGYRFNQGEANKWKSNIIDISEDEFYQYPMGETITINNPPKNKQKIIEQPRSSQTQKESPPDSSQKTNLEQNNPVPSEQDKEDDSNITVLEQRRSVVANAVQEIVKVADRNGGIGQEIKVIAQTQTQNQEKLETGIQKIQSRSGFAKFFIGPNYSEIKSSQKLLEQNREQIQKLNEARTQIVNQGDQLQVIEQIQALEQVNQQIETLLSESQKGFSLFGWLFRIFSR